MSIFAILITVLSSMCLHYRCADIDSSRSHPSYDWHQSFLPSIYKTYIGKTSFIKYLLSSEKEMTTYLGKSCSFGLPRVPFVNCRQFMYLVISLLVLRAGCGI